MIGRKCDGCDKGASKAGPIKRFKGAYFQGTYVKNIKFFVCPNCQKKSTNKYETEYYQCDDCLNKVVMHNGKRPISCLCCGCGYFTEITKEDYEEEDDTQFL